LVQYRQARKMGGMLSNDSHGYSSGKTAVVLFCYFDLEGA
jgi:hypothetical protein